MIHRRIFKSLAAAFFSLMIAVPVAWAHEDVKNPVVKERMKLMSGMGMNMKVMGDILKGKRAFDAAEVEAAIADLKARAAMVPAKFEANEDDPKSEAKAAIWSNMDDFLAKAQNLENAAAGLSGKVASKGDIPMAMQALGGTCKACHQAYKE